MQPYFFPYLGYYSLINYSDQWVVFDTVQFIRHGWIERNRILKPEDGWQYISVPLHKHRREVAIKDVRIRTDEDWQQKIFRQLEHYKKKAPHYNKTVELINKAIEIETESIVTLNSNILKVTCEYLSIPFQLQIFSQMNLSVDPVQHPGDWAVNISKAVRAAEYVNPMGGIEIFKPEQFKTYGVELRFLKNALPLYDQRRKSFEPGLSIIDVMMYNDKEEILQMVRDIEVIKL